MNTEREREMAHSSTHSISALPLSALSLSSLVFFDTNTHTHTVRIISVACVCVCILHFKVMRNLLRNANFVCSLSFSLSLFVSLTLSLCVTLTVTVLWLQMNHLLSVSGTSLEASSRGSDSDNRLAAPHQSQSEIGLLRLFARPWQQTWQP